LTNLLPKTVDRLVAMNKTVLLLGQAFAFDSFNVDCPNVASNSTPRAAACATTVKRFELPCNRIVQSLALTRKNVLYWDPNEAVCPKNICSPYHALCVGGVCRPNEPLLRMYMQMTHIGYYGSKFFGDKIVREHGVPWEFRAVTRS
jgi:hypothetical protein